jgi:hypothetical protein
MPVTMFCKNIELAVLSRTLLEKLTATQLLKQSILLILHKSSPFSHVTVTGPQVIPDESQSTLFHHDSCILPSQQKEGILLQVFQPKFNLLLVPPIHSAFPYLPQAI